MPKRTVMVLTQPIDPTADIVIERLHERNVDIVRFDTGWFPRDTALVAKLGDSPPDPQVVITPSTGRTVVLPHVTSIWYRRPRNFVFDEHLDADALDFAKDEALQAMGGVLRGAQCRWMNHPEKLISADYKPYQLMLAPRIGMSIPRTLITNDAEEARKFIRTCRGGGSIYKTLSSPEITSKKYESTAVFTSKILENDLESLETIRFTPCLLQAFVPKAFEVRVTIIGSKVFAVALKSEDPNIVDWRPVQEHISYTAHKLPSPVHEACLRMTRKLGLAFAAMDFVVTPENEYVFLEVNPNGQWAWLEEETGLPMTDAMVDWLAPFTVGSTKR